MENFLLREAAVADVAGADDAGSLAALSAAIGWPYEAGEAAASTGGLPGYLLTKVGPFVHEYEALANGHLERGAETSALVTCERTQVCFGAWGRPFAFHARMLSSLGRDEEARDKVCCAWRAHTAPRLRERIRATCLWRTLTSHAASSAEHACVR